MSGDPIQSRPPGNGGINLSTTDLSGSGGTTTTIAEINTAEQRRSVDDRPPSLLESTRTIDIRLASETSLTQPGTPIERGADVDLPDIEDLKTDTYIWRVAVITSLAGLLFGYDTGVIGTVLLHLGTTLSGHVVTADDKEMLVSLLCTGAFFGATSCLSADRLGRKFSMYLAIFLFVVGEIIQTTAFSFPQLVVGRCVNGVSIGMASTITPMYISERNERKSDSVKQLVDEARQKTKDMTFWVRFKQLWTGRANKLKTTTACGLMALSQFSGFNGLMYYSPTILIALGFDDLVALAIPATNCFFTILYTIHVDRIGKRRLTLYTVPLMVASLVAGAIAWTQVNVDFHNLDEIAVEYTDHPEKKPPLTAAAYIILISMLTFVISYASGVGNLAWASSEFFPMELRPQGTMLMNMCNWGPNAAVSASYLSMIESVGAPGTLGFYAGLCALLWFFAFFLYPEVKGFALENIGPIFEAPNPVKRANQLQREKKKERREGASKTPEMAQV